MNAATKAKLARIENLLENATALLDEVEANDSEAASEAKLAWEHANQALAVVSRMVV